MSQSQLTAACEGHRSQFDPLLIQMRACQALYRDHLLSRDEFIRRVEILCEQFFVEAEAVLALIGEYMSERDLSDRQKTHTSLDIESPIGHDHDPTDIEAQIFYLPNVH